MQLQMNYYYNRGKKCMKLKKLTTFGLIGILAMNIMGCEGYTVKINTTGTSNEMEETEKKQSASDEENLSKNSMEQESTKDDIQEEKEDIQEKQNSSLREPETKSKQETNPEDETKSEQETNTEDETKSEQKTDSSSETSSASSAKEIVPEQIGENDGTIFSYEYDELSADSVKYLPKDILRIARNEIFAKHGYIFETEDLKQFFSYKEWYKGTVKPSDWNDSVLNECEKKNLELISKYEKEEHKALDVIYDNGYTKWTDGDFTITLPENWNEGSYYVTKTESTSATYYGFYSKNNVKYGFGGHVFTLTKSTQEESSDFSDNFIELGKYGDYYYYMGQSTDVQHSHQHSVLAREWSQLNEGYNEIADSFVVN